MLTELRIRNFAIIESLSLPLAGGFNVLSGETGAGKSIIVGALGLLLGERGSADLIRTGAEKATVEGVFDVVGRPEVVAMLEERGIDADDQQVVLRREISAGGRTRAWINDSATTAGALADVGRLLVNLHGQHEAQALLDPDSQRRILDEFGVCTEEAARVRELHAALARITREIETLAARKRDAERRADYLRHVVREIEDAKLQPGEDTRIDEEARRLEHAEELRSLSAGMADALAESEGAVLETLGSVQRSLAAIQRIDPSLERLQELYDNGFYALEELARALLEYARSVDLDPARLAEVERRRDLI
ncbi:MAG TPA: AAA family ATPase, partial [Gemmatimonadaceae bacterium]|nr:AAA family ATPase [Gemmatimonadaceae bacterium]